MSTHFFKKNIILGLLLGSTTALGMFIAHAATGESGIPDVGLYPGLMTKILVDPSTSTDGKVKNANALGNIPASEFQKAITGNCPENWMGGGGTWAVGVDQNNNLICQSW